jgi:hypothetical protein
MGSDRLLIPKLRAAVAVPPPDDPSEGHVAPAPEAAATATPAAALASQGSLGGSPIGIYCDDFRPLKDPSGLFDKFFDVVVEAATPPRCEGTRRT